jgi:hypothetical protein
LQRLPASSYMGKYLRISSYMTLQLLHSEFPYIWGKFDFLFYQCIVNQDEGYSCHRKNPTQYHYLALWVYHLMEDDEVSGILCTVCETVELASSVNTWVYQL